MYTSNFIIMRTCFPYILPINLQIFDEDSKKLSSIREYYQQTTIQVIVSKNIHPLSRKLLKKHFILHRRKYKGVQHMQGWIKLYRNLLEKSIWKNSTPEQKVILIVVLLLANHKYNQWEWHGEQFTCQPGQFVTSLESLLTHSGKKISIQKIRTALKKFKKYEFLTWETTNTGSLITIVNWDKYQTREQNETDESNDCQQTYDKQPTHNKNVNNSKKSIYTESFEKFYSIYPRADQKQQTFKNWKSRLKEYSEVDLIEAASKYKAQMIKEKREKEYMTNSSNFLGKKCVFMDYLSSSGEEESDASIPKERELIIEEWRITV